LCPYFSEEDDASGVPGGGLEGERFVLNRYTIKLCYFPKVCYLFFGIHLFIIVYPSETSLLGSTVPDADQFWWIVFD
jgi:hypothetical protein